jgi:hypothetical protein
MTEDTHDQLASDCYTIECNQRPSQRDLWTPYQVQAVSEED